MDLNESSASALPHQTWMTNAAQSSKKRSPSAERRTWFEALDLRPAFLAAPHPGDHHGQSPEAAIND